MQQKKINKVLTIIWITSVLAILVQIMRIYDMYDAVQNQFHRDIKTALDNAVGKYYAESGTKTVSIETDILEEDSLLNIETKSTKASISLEEIGLDKTFDREDKSLKDRLTVIISKDTVDMEELNHMIQSEMKYYGIKADYRLLHFFKGTLSNEFGIDNESYFEHAIFSSSKELPRNHQIEFKYSPSFSYVLFKGGVEVIISITFLVLIIYALWKVYDSAKRQKDLVTLKNDFINNLSHDFKTPVSAAKVAIEAAQKFNPDNDPEKNGKYLQIAERYLDQVSEMIDRLLESASFESESDVLIKKDFDLVKMINDLLTDSEVEKKSKKVDFHSSDPIIRINADIFHVKRAVLNFMDNAFKYGGEMIYLRLNSYADKVQIIVSDNGQGIPKEARTKIFEQFYRVPGQKLRQIKGHGIGLYYSKKVIEAHAGTLELEIKDNWTNFIITIPCKS